MGSKMKTGLKVMDAMTRSAVTVSPETSVFECAKKMKEERLGSLIIQEKGKLSGILSEQDLVHKIIAKGINPKKTPVKDIMTSEVVSISPEKDITDAILKMSLMNVRRLPVVEDSNIVGILTSKDILKIEPQLFEVLVDKMELREEKRKPINRIGEREGICELCGNYANYLFEQDEIMVCKYCKE
ncbi:CBS domain-containing protein [Candidatus Woesearchaeota archaeon]|nr:CBS domain-containing protein [Candidatus Woesearchaeota archaeon]